MNTQILQNKIQHTFYTTVLQIMFTHTKIHPRVVNVGFFLSLLENLSCHS